MIVSNNIIIILTKTITIGKKIYYNMQTRGDYIIKYACFKYSCMKNQHGWYQYNVEYKKETAFGRIRDRLNCFFY